MVAVGAGLDYASQVEEAGIHSEVETQVAKTMMSEFHITGESQGDGPSFPLSQVAVVS